MVKHQKKKKLRAHDRLLKQFKYAAALDSVLESEQQPVIVYSLLSELAQRDGLTQALSGRDEFSLRPVLQFVIKHVVNPRYSPLLLDVAEILLGKTLGR